MFQKKTHWGCFRLITEGIQMYKILDIYLDCVHIYIYNLDYVCNLSVTVISYCNLSSWFLQYIECIIFDFTHQKLPLKYDVGSIK